MTHTHGVKNEGHNGRVEILSASEDDAALDHEVEGSDQNGEDCAKVLRVGEVAEPEG